jgi:mRNA interferase MazF
VINSYIPKQQDIIWIDFNPQSGKEINKRRPALVLSNDNYNRQTGLVVISPITHTNKNDLTYILITGAKTDGFVNALQIHSFDYKTRNASFIEIAPSSVLLRVMQVFEQIF